MFIADSRLPLCLTILLPFFAIYPQNSSFLPELLLTIFGLCQINNRTPECRHKKHGWEAFFAAQFFAHCQVAHLCSTHTRIGDAMKIYNARELYLICIDNGHPACDVAEDICIFSCGVTESGSVNQMDTDAVIPHEAKVIDIRCAYIVASDILHSNRWNNTWQPISGEGKKLIRTATEFYFERPIQFITNQTKVEYFEVHSEIRIKEVLESNAHVSEDLDSLQVEEDFDEVEQHQSMAETGEKA